MELYLCNGTVLVQSTGRQKAPKPPKLSKGDIAYVSFPITPSSVYPLTPESGKHGKWHIWLPHYHILVLGCFLCFVFVFNTSQGFFWTKRSKGVLHILSSGYQRCARTWLAKLKMSVGVKISFVCWFCGRGNILQEDRQKKIFFNDSLLGRMF